MVKFLFVFYPFAKEGLHITGTKRQLFLEQGIVRVRANSPTQGKIRFFLRCFLRYIEIIPEKNIQFRSLIQNVNFFLFFVFKMLNNVAIINNNEGIIQIKCK